MPGSEVQVWLSEELRSRTGLYVVFQAARIGGITRPGRGPAAELSDSARGDATGGNFVVSSGAQLHRLYYHREILHLFHWGFSTNMCVVGCVTTVYAMAYRCYDCLLVHDCTTGYHRD